MEKMLSDDAKNILIEENLKLGLKEAYYSTIEFLKDYIDMKEEYYPLVAVWTIGTHFHNSFRSYPYLFVNSMKGSGKTLLLELIKFLSKDGDMLNSLTDAVLFRSQGTLCIDEFEGVMRKGKESLRELLNSAYKKGAKVKRLRKTSTKEGEKQVLEEFDVFRPIAMANIWGMEEVLGDRCLNITLEKSGRPEITKKQPIFDEDIKKSIYFNLDCANLLSSHNLSVECVESTQCRVDVECLYREWNNFITHKYAINDTQIHHTLTTLHTHTTQTTPFFDDRLTEPFLELFNKIDATEIQGRHLELFFPLFIISYLIDYFVLEKMLNFAKDIIKQKKIEEITTSKDVCVFDFVSRKEPTQEYHSMKKIAKEFQEFLEIETEEVKWFSAQWFGRALQRLNLIIDRRRLGKGVEITLNVQKAKEKMLLFKSKEEK